jgi:hypothetical protein
VGLPAAAYEFIHADDGELLREDTLCWAKWYFTHDWYTEKRADVPAPDHSGLRFHLDKLFMSLPEFRNLFDYRVRSVAELHRCLWSMPRSGDLYIACDVIGPRFRIQHGQNTYVYARKIGSDFFVNHNVTVGSHNGTPIIGDRVSIRTGAVVVGSITIGDDALITANAVVTTDMPAGYAAYAPRTVFKARTLPSASR